MDKPHIEIYGRDGCPWCIRAKLLCMRNGLPFVYHDMTRDQALQDEFVTRTNGAKTVPQIFVGIRRIGGHDDLLAGIENRTIQQLLGGN
jgi:glutaredoxin